MSLMFSLEVLRKLVEPDAIFDMATTQCRASFFVLRIARQSTNEAVDELFRPCQVRGRLVYPSAVMGSFNELHFTVIINFYHSKNSVCYCEIPKIKIINIII